MKITNSQMAYQQLKRKISYKVEEFWVLGLRANKSVISAQCLFRGTVDHCLFHPRDVIRFACLHNASSILIAHSHPSDDPSPSTHDIDVTLKMKTACTLMDIPLVDHLIISSSSYISFVDHNLCSLR